MSQGVVGGAAFVEAANRRSNERTMRVLLWAWGVESWRAGVRAGLGRVCCAATSLLRVESTRGVVGSDPALESFNTLNLQAY